MSIKPILFNTPMVRAILDGRKSCTRRIVNPQPQGRLCYTFAGGDCGTWGYPSKTAYENWGDEYKLPEDITDEELKRRWNPPYHTDDILYVRETWRKGLERYIYRADYSDTEKFYRGGKEIEMKWHPSIHMPKEAARIWLKVTDVRVERLQEITEEQACMEGTDPWDEACYENNGWHPTLSDPDSGGDPNMIDGFHKLWNSTIKKSDLDYYGWSANPWVWVIEFERCERGGVDER
ncbi:hypothetical protein [Coprococcus sp. AF38-1]|uniref:hypothetical protein n=1 Tax=Coprococcus sp. AF38-1 TaxID=2302943 RepID=UPI001A9AA3B2|nr:hypothetical protein [Coprococcus sp. AF38-1]